MTNRCTVLAASLAMLVLGATTHAVAQDAAAEPEAPDAEPAPSSPARGVRAVAHQQVVMLLNPMGAEHRLDVGLRAELGDPHDLLASGAHVEGGVTTAVSPVYAMGGGYVEIAPLSFLVLRCDLVGATVWPIGMSGAGHYGLGGYDADVRPQALPADGAGTASGWLATVSATLQGALDVGGGVRLLLLSELGLTRATMGNAAFYYSMRHDLILAREDVAVLSSSFLGLEVRAASDLVVRFGAYDDLRFVPGSGYVGHQLGPVVMVEWQHVAPAVGALSLFVRGGGYTHHVTRAEQATVLGGVAIDYELGGL